MRPWAKALLAGGVMAAILGGLGEAAQSPPGLARYGLELAIGGGLALCAGIALSVAAAFEERLIETKALLEETRRQLEAATEALNRPPSSARAEPIFRSRPARARRSG